jgi:hypothetical protein
MVDRLQVRVVFEGELLKKLDDIKKHYGLENATEVIRLLVNEQHKQLSRGKMIEYKTLEQQIQELWACRGMEVIEETCEAVGKNKFKWTITAKKKDLLEK